MSKESENRQKLNPLTVSKHGWLILSILIFCSNALIAEQNFLWHPQKAIVDQENGLEKVFIPPKSIASTQNGENEVIELFMLPTYNPIFTGPFLAPTPVNMDPSHPSIQVSMTMLGIYGVYNANWGIDRIDTIWALNPFIDFQLGFTKRLGLEFQIPFVTNFQKGKSFSYFQDINVLFGMQILNDKKDTWIPDLRLMIQQTFPTGRYKKFTHDQSLIQSTGMGAFQTGPVLAIYKKLYFPQHVLGIGGGLIYLFPLTVDVQGFNTYGGGFKTKGRVKPGQTLSVTIASEYSIAEHWIITCEMECFFRRSSYFHGRNGVQANGKIANTGLPPFLQLNFAPEVEYIFNENLGIISGFWFSFAGKNAPAFASAFFDVVHQF